jgi:signal transduction histidine kinase
MMPAVFPIVVRSIRFETVICTWFVCVFFTTLSMVHVGGELDWVTMVLLGISLCFVFEGERLSRLSFLNLELIEAKGKADVEKNKADVDRRNEMELAFKERKQLVALIGNVAHDLKTPLQSFKMDIEFMRNVVNSLARRATTLQPPSQSQAESQSKAESQSQSQSQADDLVANAESLLQSLTANTEFMAMAVNRGIEFAKTSGGIKLSPAMASFNLVEALSMPLKLMESVQSESTVRMEPLPASIHPQIITDLHWLRENVLCLLSNALKYSDDGTSVTLIVDLVTDDQVRAQAQCSKRGDAGETTASADSRESCDAAVPALPTVTATTGQVPTPAPAPAGLEPLQFVRITIIDGGIGIPEHDRRMLFQAFQQAQRLAGGTGLGLFSLSQRMQALRGHCGVESRPDGGRGSAFWFAFPYKPDRMSDTSPGNSSGQTSGATTPPAVVGIVGAVGMGTVGGVVGPVGAVSVAGAVGAGGSSPRTRQLRILVVDDSLSILKVTGRGITHAGHNCETAQNGSLALDRLQRALPAGEIDLVSAQTDR